MITIIAAVADNYVLGKNNQLIWHLPEDLRRFKRITAGHCVIMGRKTFESLNGPLPKRKNIIITRNKDYRAENCFVVHSLEEALQLSQEDDNPFILGGAQIYEQALQFAERMDLTWVHHNFDGDAFFPNFDKSIWVEIEREDHKKDEKNKYDYSFVKYKKNG
ncbi:dihydrofolate reductase [Namhaeicola litoreus]|uniref:Dihydrofolate reductase n=1 Tax=Namhaeicola litoreus TaxID=1052145 RepID=A0ABW3XZT5_9FLAO